MKINSELAVWGGGVAAVLAYFYARVGNTAGGRKFIIDFISGGVAGAIAKTLTAPIENCKTALQCQDIHPDVKTGIVQRYNGIADYFARTVREKGVLALFEGNTVNVLRYFPTQAFNFAFKDSIKRLFPKYNAKTQFWKFFAANMAMGGVAGAGSLAVVYPLDYVRTVQKYDLSGRYKDESFVSIARKIVRRRGLLTLYSGFGVSVLGIGAYIGLHPSTASGSSTLPDTSLASAPCARTYCADPEAAQWTLPLRSHVPRALFWTLRRFEECQPV